MQFLDPQKVIQHFDLEEGMHVVELHAGGGHFTPHLKKHIGTYGLLHSLQHDESEEYIELPEKVERVLAVNILLEGNHHALFKKAYRILRPQGKIIFITAKGGDLAEGDIVHLAGLAGFLHERRFHAGNHHFGLVFKKV
jgi:predicted methyltransferase